MSAEDVLDSFISKNHKEARRWADICEEMLNDGRYMFAYDTLYGIMSAIESADKVTENQKIAITNIKESAR